MTKPLLISILLLGLVLPAKAENSPLESHLSRGYDYLDKGQFDDAIIEFLEVLSIEPENPEAIEGIEKASCLEKKTTIRTAINSTNPHNRRSARDKRSQTPLPQSINSSNSPSLTRSQFPPRLNLSKKT